MNRLRADVEPELVISLVVGAITSAAVWLALGGSMAAARISPRAPRANRPLRRGRARTRALDHAFPDALELYVLALQAGLLPAQAMSELQPMVHPVVGEAFAQVERRVQQGERFIEALDALVEVLGVRALTFVGTIAMAERTGLPAVPMIERLADDARRHRRRCVEADARELPVRLAFPLVLCTLPSFALVAIAPVLVGALSSLRAA